MSFQIQYYNSKTQTNFESYGSQFSTECKISITNVKADIGSKGNLIVNLLRVLWDGSPWLPSKTKWPDQLFITSPAQSEKETKCIKELVTTAIQSIEISLSIIKVRVT